MERLSTALRLLERCVDAYPTASGHHHLGILLSRPSPAQDLQRAIFHVRQAVELEHGEMRHWHLLGLLEAAVGDWRAARNVLDVGAALDEVEPPLDPPGNGNGNAEPGVLAHDFAPGLPPSESNSADEDSSEEVVLPSRRYLLPEDTREIPLAATLLGPQPDHPPPSQQDLFEHALKLRMSQVALAEHIEGAEGVGDNWTEVFAWFAEKKGTENVKGEPS
jgi:hypothetical protein